METITIRTINIGLKCKTKKKIKRKVYFLQNKEDTYAAILCTMCYIGA